MMSCVADLGLYVRAAVDLFFSVSVAFSDTLKALGFGGYVNDSHVLLRLPIGLNLFIPFLLVIAFLIPRRYWRVSLLVASIAFGFICFGPTWTLALLAASIFTFVYHEVAVTFFQLDLERTLPQIVRPYLPQTTTAALLRAAAEFKRLVTPYQPSFALGCFWLITSAAIVYCFVFPPDWFDRFPLPLHFMHVAGFAFLYIKLLSYSRDVLLGHTPNRTLYGVLQWVFFHPTVRMGPIQRYGEFHQMVSTMPRSTSRQNLAQAAVRVLIGNLKIAAILLIERFALPPSAGSFGLLTDFASTPQWQAWQGFTAPHTLTTLDLLLGILFQYLRFYLFFSACADFACGLCRILGMNLPENFDRPFWAASVPEFWRRWHITLGAFCRNDIYIPLGGNRKHTARNVIIVFVFIGLWHELGWTVAWWGLTQALALIVHRWWLQRHWPGASFPGRQFICILLTQAYVALTFCGLYDSQYAGLAIIEVLIRRALGDTGPPSILDLS